MLRTAMAALIGSVLFAGAAHGQLREIDQVIFGMD